MHQDVALLRLPSWLNPWWQVKYEISATLSPEATRAALSQRTGRLRGRSTPDGTLVLVRHGGFMNGFVRAHAELSPEGAGTRLSVQIARPQATSAFLSVLLPLLFLGPLVRAIEVAVGFGLISGAGWLPLVLIGPAIWAAVIGANYTSARSEADDLRRLIGDALKT